MGKQEDIDSAWIDGLIENYYYKKSQRDYVQCSRPDCIQPYTFLVIDEAPQPEQFRNHNKKLGAKTKGYTSRYTGETWPFCDEHYVEWRKTASPERIREIRKGYMM